MNINIKREEYFDHPHNTTIENERAIEVVMGLRYLKECGKSLTKDRIIEIGSVMPHYLKQPVSHEVLDPEDPYATIVDFAENHSYKGDHVLSISTIEHIGKVGPRDQFKNAEEENLPLGYNLLCRIYEESKSCLISWPIGYNTFLDNSVLNSKENGVELNYFFYIKMCSEPEPVWELEQSDEGFKHFYGTPFSHANSVIFVHNMTS